jgi:hypothetical protein
VTDHATLHDVLRRSTATMLHYDVDDLSPIRALRLDLACSLRLEIDRNAALQARGEPADLRALTLAVESLERLLHLAEVTASDGGPRAGSAKERLRDLIQRVIIDAPAQAEATRVQQLEREVEQLRAELARRGEFPHVEKAPPSAAAAAPAAAAAAATAPEMPTAPRGAVVPLRAPASDRPPAHYLKQPEPWRPYVTESGIRSASSFAPPGGPPRGW